MDIIIPLKGNRITELNINDLMRGIKRDGLTLLRGFDIDLPLYECFSKKICSYFHKVGTRSVFKHNESDGFSVDVSRGNFELFMHSEGTYRSYPTPPDICFFWSVCAPAAVGGETTVVDGVEFLNKLPTHLRERFENEGVIYQSQWEKSRWCSEFLVEDVKSLEALLQSIPAINYELDGDVLHVRCKVDVILTTMAGEKSFANALLAHLPYISHPNFLDSRVYVKPTNRVFFGGGEEIPGNIINLLIDIQESILVAHRWQINDCLIVDNRRFLHGRKMTASPCERVLVSRFGSF